MVLPMVGTLNEGVESIETVDFPVSKGFWGFTAGFYASPKPKVESSNLSCPAMQVPYGRLVDAENSSGIFSGDLEVIR
jgi:hypothetical protein